MLMDSDLTALNCFRWERNDQHAGTIEDRELKPTHPRAAVMKDRDDEYHVLFDFIDVQGSGSREVGASSDWIGGSALDLAFDQH